MSKKVAIGIDLGTTNSCVAVYRNGKVDIIVSETGKRVTPSFVTFEEDEVHVGEAAKLLSYTNLENSVYEAKRLIGCRFSEKNVQDDIKNWRFEVIDDNDVPKIKVPTCEGGSKVFTPEQISSYVLLKLKITAETFIGAEIEDAVITVPAYFSDSQRQATIDAGKIAGLNVLSIINEPTAAAIAYGVDKPDIQDQTVLVYDFGGGTFDVSILSISSGKYSVKAVGGDTHLGGSDIDMVLVNHFLKILYEKHGKGLSENPRHLWRLREACEKAKIYLSTPTGLQTKVVVEGLLGGDDFDETLNRSKFEQLNMDVFEKTMEHVTSVLRSADMTPGDIDEVILIGGSSRIPKIQEMLSSLFDGKTLNSTINPDEAVAYGAAVKAAIESGEHTIEDLTLEDVVPTSLGIENVFGDVIKFIDRNTQIPTRAVQDTWSTVVDYQTQVKINVYEGEEKKAKDSHLLGSFNLELGERVKAGIPKLTITFEIDANGIMDVKAENKRTESEMGITITANKGRLDEQEIEEMIRDGKQLKIS